MPFENVALIRTGPSSGLPLWHLDGLEAVQERDSALHLIGGGKDGAPVIRPDLQSAGEVACVIGSWLEFGKDAEIGAQIAAAELGDQLLTRALRTIRGIAGEIAVDPVRRGRPVRLMP